MSEQGGTELLEKMARQEPFRRLMDVQVLRIAPGYAKVRMKVDQNMLNIHGITHGGALFALVDEAFELASNSHGTVAVALNMNITFFAPTGAGDVLTAEAKEINKTRRTATYQISVSNQDGQLVCICQALVYRKRDPLPGIARNEQET